MAPPDPQATRRRWEAVAHPEGPPDWFAGWETMPPFAPDATGFSPAQAWWLASLCRIAYTPDRKEAGRPWHRGKPDRRVFLEERTPFREALNVHKTGCHASLYRLADRPGAVLCFRGTNKIRQWIMNLSALPVPWIRSPDRDPRPCVHHGFQTLFERIWPLVEPALSGIEGPLHLTGHSLGGAFATLAAAALEEAPAGLVTFGSPRVGNAAFAHELAARATPHLRVVNHLDIVTRLPQREPRLGNRDFRHAGPPILLGSGPDLAPGPFHDPGWDPDQPLAWLARSVTGPEPPPAVLAHLPTAYVERLRRLHHLRG